MKKTIAAVLALIMLLALAGCGSSYKSDSAVYEGSYYASSTTAAEAPMANYDSAWGDDYYYETSEYAEEAQGASGSIDSESLGNTKANVKLIYRANMSVQTTDFQQTYQSLVDLVNANGGYFESSNVNNGGYFSDGSYMSGYYTVRIPSENYGAFVNAVGSSCHVVNLNESVEDVGLAYFEIESRLETLKIKEDRLQGLLAEADNMTDIIDLENALSDCEYQIDMYKSSLNRYDSLIGYSTINIDIEKVTVYTPAVQEELTFGQRVERAFEAGVTDFRDGFEDFIVWGSRNILDILLILVIILVICAIHPFRRLRARNDRWSEKHQAKKEMKAEKKAAKAAGKAQKGKKSAAADPVEINTGDGEGDWSQPAYVESDQDGNEKK
ncbi:MAG: DUF4349 domain-containing protein [Clostridia bacterium]|nr:DUF4349 domain-containing protein [Clostridia bacterium]